MDKKVIIILIILIAIAIWGMISHNSKKNIPVENNLQTQEEVQQTQNEPNPMDYVAPGYSNAQNKIKNLREIRQQSLEQNQKDIDDVLNNY